ncbi:MAG: sigma-70 family RNA polymerase sigma factor [Bacteroidota bacterium]
MMFEHSETYINLTMEQSDHIIIQKVLRGNQQAYEVLVRRYQDYVFTVVLRILKKREVAEEVAQDVFIKAYRTLRSFKGNSKFSTWLYTIAYRSAIDEARKKKYSIDTLDAEKSALQIADAYDQSPIAKTQQSSLKNVLEEQIQQLKTEDAAVVTLHYFQEKSVKEVAEITGLSLSNVKVKLYRSREFLKKRLQHYLGDELKDLISDF